MRHDLLYTIFEQHLYNAHVEDESTGDFLARVVRDYLRLLTSRGRILQEHLADIESDLREEVLEMLRKKTYGHYNLAEFRKAHAANLEQVAADQNQKRRSRGAA